jgi:hypothetical protein
LNGSLSTLCITCKGLEKIRSLNLRLTYNNLKLEYMQKCQSSCEKFQCIFLKPFENTHSVVKFETFEKDGIRYFEYEGDICPVLNVINFQPDLLELAILEFDHLPESEQRTRGMLSSNEQYIPKKNQVCKLSSETAMRLEVLKCQLLCGKCHLIETIIRESSGGIREKSILEQQKLEYTNGLKLLGCELCKYRNDDLPRFFHFDHIDPKIKKDNVSRMIKDGAYTLDEVITECKKCRILCKDCHIIHTKNQRKEGLI